MGNSGNCLKAKRGKAWRFKGLLCKKCFLGTMGVEPRTNCNNGGDCSLSREVGNLAGGLISMS